MSPGDPSVLFSRLLSDGPKVSTFCAFWKLLETMFLYLLIMGVSAFTIPPAEHMGKKQLGKCLPAVSLGKAGVLCREILLLLKKQGVITRGEGIKGMARWVKAGQIYGSGKLDFGW